MSEIPRARRLYRAEQVRELDRIAIEEFSIAGNLLMQRAGRAAFHALLAKWDDPQHITVYCGAGNNAGDGYVVAQLAHERGMPVTLYYLRDPDQLTGEAHVAMLAAREAGVTMESFNADALPKPGVIVDALLGTGASGELRPDYAQAIEVINASFCPVIALDLPSGLNADTGQTLGMAVRAACTITFIGVKRGLLTGEARDYVGELEFVDLLVPEDVYARMAPDAQWLDIKLLAEILPRRQQCSHKGMFGHVLVIGGNSGMAGAAVMAAQAAGRCGAGLVSCATLPQHVPALVSRCPEVMVHGINSVSDLEPLLARASVLVIGPGLGSNTWAEQMLHFALATELPAVVDADALSLIKVERLLAKQQRDNWVLTPHPGEAAKLLDCSTADIQSGRFTAVASLQKQFGGAVVLKGSGSLIASGDGDATALCSYGNPGMASGGMGDVLSGVIGALIAQGLSVGDAARLGVCLHGLAADLAAQDGERGMLATDLLPKLRQLVNAV